VNNPTPTTSVLIPANRATLSGAASLLDAAASTGAQSVTYELNGGSASNQLIATATPTLYGGLAQWDTTTVPNGTYTLQSVASYYAGTAFSVSSTPISITVAN
jgi:hypothetical protein